MSVDLDRLMARADELWEESIIPSLTDFIEIEALSPSFEPNWKEKGELNYLFILVLMFQLIV